MLHVGLFWSSLPSGKWKSCFLCFTLAWLVLVAMTSEGGLFSFGIKNLSFILAVKAEILGAPVLSIGRNCWNHLKSRELHWWASPARCCYLWWEQRDGPEREEILSKGLDVLENSFITRIWTGVGTFNSFLLFVVFHKLIGQILVAVVQKWISAAFLPCKTRSAPIPSISRWQSWLTLANNFHHILQSCGFYPIHQFWRREGKKKGLIVKWIVLR